MSKYVRGVRLERRVKKHLEDKGFFVVRAAASKPVDLVAIREGEVYLIECKVRLSGEHELRRLLELSEETGVKTLMASKRGRELVFIDPLTNECVDL